MMILGVWNNVQLIGVSCEEYKELYRKHEIDTDIAYVLLDNKNYIILNGKVVGYTLSNHSRIKRFNNTDLTWEQLTGFKRIVVTERASVEKLASDGEKRLKAVVAEAPVVEATGEQLAKVIEEGQVTMAKVRKRRKPRATTVE